MDVRRQNQRYYYESELYKLQDRIKKIQDDIQSLLYGYVSDPRISNGSLLNLKHLKGEPLEMMQDILRMEDLKRLPEARDAYLDLIKQNQK